MDDTVQRAKLVMCRNDAREWKTCPKCNGVGCIETTTSQNKKWRTFRPCDCDDGRVYDSTEAEGG